MARPNFLVVKVGGSLYDLHNLRSKLHAWLEDFSDCAVCIIPGGGKTADVVRDWDRRHELGEEKAHWLALRSLTLNAHWLADLLPRATVLSTPKKLLTRKNPFLFILDAHAFGVFDEQNADHLPHTWETTSDSVAARVAIVFGADHLYLLKSVDIPPAITWREAAEAGFVDSIFPSVVDHSPLQVHAINFREWELPHSDTSPNAQHWQAGELSPR